MLLPIGDSLKKRTPPFLGLALIAFNILAALYEYRLWQDDPQHGLDLMEFIITWGLVPERFAEGDYLPLFTSMFLHADIMHLLGNLFVMWLLLPSLESGLGSFKFLVMYLFAGVAAGATHCLMMGSLDNTPMIGASGAISGMIGAYFVAFGALASVWMAWNGGFITGFRWVKFQLPAGIYVFFWLILPNIAGIEEAVASGEHAGVAWYAHAGGFVAGTLFMLVFRSDVHAKLHTDEDGEYVIADSAEEALQKPVRVRPTTVSRAPGEPFACIYCRTPLDEGLAVAENLVRCGNPTCRRLNQVDATPVLESVRT